VPISNALGIMERTGFFNVAGLAAKSSRFTQWFDRNKDCVFATTEASSLDHIIVSTSLKAGVKEAAFRNDLYTASCSGFNSDHYPITTTIAAI
jgi:exonuclease III